MPIFLYFCSDTTVFFYQRHCWLTKTKTIQASMKKLLFTLLAAATSVCASAQFDYAPAFPGAEGFGRYTSGGRGGAVYHVTSLADDGSEGTLRWACQKSGKRTIVFDVSGTIYLTSALQLKNGDVSILGQTAPGDGICVADYPFTINSSNVIIRFIRFRLGNRQVAYHEGDGLGGMDQSNIVVDHCSVSWSIDECLSVYGSKNISVQWNIVDQSLVNSGHSKGSHGYGGNWGGSGASYHHNLMAHHTSRTPRLGPRPGTQTDERMDMRNNVIYNWGGNGCYGGEGMNVNIVNNYYKPGPGTKTRSTTIQQRIAAPGIRTSEYTHHNTNTPNQWDVMWHVWGKYYVDGNVNPNYASVTNNNWTYGIYNQIDAGSCDGTYSATTRDTIKILAPIAFGHVTTQAAETAYEKVVAYAGASYKRDAHDAYIANDVLTGTASHCAPGTVTGFIDNQDQAGGWPELKSDVAPTDTDGDGMPDEWETQHGLNPNDATDRNKYNLDSHHYYTNLEVYCNSLVEDMVKAQNAGALTDVEGAFEEYYPDYQNGEVEAAATLYAHPGEKGNTITWEDGAKLTITGSSSKTLDPAGVISYENNTSKSIKLSNGAQNTFTCPEGKVATEVTFISYVNADPISKPCYWGEIAGTKYDAASSTLMQSARDAENPDINTFTLPNLSSFTFTNSGTQVCFLMKVMMIDATDAKGVQAVSEASAPMDVYSLSGKLLVKGATKAQIAALPKGIYVAGGKKLTVK